MKKIILYTILIVAVMPNTYAHAVGGNLFTCKSIYSYIYIRSNWFRMGGAEINDRESFVKYNEERYAFNGSVVIHRDKENNPYYEAQAKLGGGGLKYIVRIYPDHTFDLMLDIKQYQEVLLDTGTCIVTTSDGPF